VADLLLVGVVSEAPLRVVVAGGGVAGLELALALRALAEERVSVEIVAPETDFVYRPLAVVEPFRAGEVVSFPLPALVRAAGAELHAGEVAAVEAARKTLVTRDGAELPYDVLVVALGARPREAVPGALTFRGPQDGPALAALLEEVVDGRISNLAFAVPAGATWPLPLYELALLTETYLADRGTMEVELALVTPEEAPLAIFGRDAAEAIEELLAARGIGLLVRTTPFRFEHGALQVMPAGALDVDGVIALPRAEGPFLSGLPNDVAGFVPTDPHGRVVGVDDVYAAGDVTHFPVKQGGIATQQADAVAEAIAARAGAPVEPEPFRPVLRGLLLTGLFPRFLRAELGTAASTIDTEALWWPPAKIVGRYLAPFLAERIGLADMSPPHGEGAVPVEVVVEPAG
jgi:sulfide:quinone oxidoreductase